MYIFFVDYLLTNRGPISIHGTLALVPRLSLNKSSTVNRASVKNTFHSETSYTQVFKYQILEASFKRRCAVSLLYC